MDTKNSLTHLAIIMDGNGRWAQENGLARRDGHKEGAKVVRQITTWCAQNSISYLTLYAFSTENWRRPRAEVEFLMQLLSQYLKKERQTYLEHGIRFRAIGDISTFSNLLKEMILELEEISAGGNNLTQILALNYGGRDEISRACMKALKKIKTEKLKDIDKTKMQELLETYLDTAGIPDVDLLIRTGGEMRISNFLLWQTNYAELAFSPTFWPDFKICELENIIQRFQNKTRRFGGL